MQKEYIGREMVLEIVKRTGGDYVAAWSEIRQIPAADVAPVVHGEWLLTAHKESANDRWNVTAKCSVCGDYLGEIWAAFFPGHPDDLAAKIAMYHARRTVLQKYCSECGAKMDGGKE